MSPAQRAAFDGAGAVLAIGTAEISETAAAGGPQAVAQAAAPNGSDEEQAALAGYLERLQHDAAEHTPAITTTDAVDAA